MKKRWVVLNVLCIGIVCMMMTSCTNVIKLRKKSFNDGYIGYTRNCVAFFLMLKMFLHHKKKLNIL